MTAHVEVMDLVAKMKAAEQAFVLATVVRTVSVTAAKAGAKPIIRPDGFALGDLHPAKRFIVVWTQGKGDEAALRAAVATEAAYHAFVGSRRKMAALREKLVAGGVSPDALDRIKAPAGLDLGAITPEEIAMSILAEITVERRRGQRAGTAGARPD